MRTVATLLAACAAVAYGVGPKWHELDGYTFEQYQEDFPGKQYEGEEADTRRALFQDSLQAVQQHNAQDGLTWKKGINQFSDMTMEEYRVRLGYKTSASEPTAVGSLDTDVRARGLGALPDSVDWRTSGVVSAVKDQGHCGSCWAHSTTESIESHTAINTGRLYVLSVQELVACLDNGPGYCGGAGGCSGSTATAGFSFIAGAGGQSEEWTFPYVSYWGTTNGTCNWEPKSTTPAVATIDGFASVTNNNATALMTAVANVGPIAINVFAEPWKDYESGVYDGCGYSGDIDIDHAVQLVGYGTDDSGADYWLVRNSWSASWGEAGYIRLKRNPVDATPCGMDSTPADGDGCRGDTTPVKVCGTCGVLYNPAYPVNARLV